MNPKFVYIGQQGEFHNGIPARNLTEEDWGLLTDDQREIVTSSPLYKAAEKKTAVKKDGE